MATQFSGLVGEAFDAFVDNVVGTLPDVAAGLVFLVLAAVTVRVVVAAVRAVLTRAFASQPVYVQLGTTLATIALWFGVLLAFLSAVGLPEIAAALGTASGFLALGVSYALSGMLADAVAGLYLLRDPDFNPGDEVVAGDVSGTVQTIELRKTRFENGDGDTVVRANAEVEKKWTRKTD